MNEVNQALVSGENRHLAKFCEADPLAMKALYSDPGEQS